MKLGKFETSKEGNLARIDGPGYGKGYVPEGILREFISALHAAHERGEVVTMSPGDVLITKGGRVTMTILGPHYQFDPPKLEPLTAEAIGAAVAKALDEHRDCLVKFNNMATGDKGRVHQTTPPEPITAKTTSELLDGDEPTVGEIAALRFLAEQARFYRNTAFDSPAARMNRIDYALIQLDKVTKP